MTDQNLDNIFGNDPAAEEDLDNFLGDGAQEHAGDAPAGDTDAAPAPSYVVLQSTSGEQVRVTVGADEQTEGMPGVPLHVVLGRSGRQFGGNNTYFNGSIQTSLNDLVVPGSTVTVIGTMKGGARH